MPPESVTAQFHALMKDPRALDDPQLGQQALALLEAGANPNAPTLDAAREAAYPLFNAIAERRPAWVECLLRHGADCMPAADEAVLADPTHSPVGPFSPLSAAVDSFGMHLDDPSLECLRLVLSAGADPLQADPFTLRTPFDNFVDSMACEHLYPQMPEAECERVFQALECMVAALPAQLAQGFCACLAQGGKDTDYPQAVTVGGWPSVGARIRSRQWAQQMAQRLPPPRPAQPVPRL